jgi:hypothetical protein
MGLWAADFLISGIGWRIGGLAASLSCFLLAGLLIFWAITKKEKASEKKPSKSLQNWHRYGMGAFAFALVITIGIILFFRHGAPEKSDIPTNSLIQNAGTTSDLTVIGGSVTAPKDGNATLVNTLPRGTTSKEHMENVQVGSGELTPITSSAGLGIASHGVSYNLRTINAACGDISKLEITSKGQGTANALVDSDLNDVRKCKWAVFVTSAFRHMRDMEPFVDKWQQATENSWNTLPKPQRESNRKEFYAIRVQLLGLACAGEFPISRMVEMIRNPPSFELQMPPQP